MSTKDQEGSPDFGLAGAPSQEERPHPHVSLVAVRDAETLILACSYGQLAVSRAAILGWANPAVFGTPVLTAQLTRELLESYAFFRTRLPLCGNTHAG
jgi:hypothetical protein